METRGFKYKLNAILKDMKIKVAKFKKHRLVIIIVAGLVVATASGLGVYYYSATAKIQQDAAAHQELLRQYDKKIATLKKQRAERIAAEKKAAEEKARQEAEVVRKAEAAKNLADQQAGQVVTPKGCVASDAHSNPAAITVVINKKRCFSPIDFTPPDLTTVSGATISAKAAPSFSAMLQAAAAAGAPLSVTSSFRSYSNQVSTYNYWVKINGSAASADTVSARPGYSEHQTGLAIDFSAGGCSLECFAGTAQYTWMKANAAEYGFIERYMPGMTSITGYSPEAWHYRYVGATVAKDMKAKGVKTLEQYWSVAGGDY